MTDALDAALRPWILRSDDLIARGIADARAHAELGRAVDAHARLDELRGGVLAIQQDARAEFYRRAFDAHRDPDIHRTDVGPSEDGERAARDAQIGGQDLWLEAARWATAAARELSGAYAAARTLPDEATRTAAFSAWEARHRDAIRHWSRTALSDAQMALHNVVGHILVRPEMKDEDTEI